MRFERPGFKMTKEMIDLLGKNEPEIFKRFKKLVIKGYLIVRKNAKAFIEVVSSL